MSFVSVLTTSKGRNGASEQANDSGMHRPNDDAPRNGAAAGRNRADRGLALIATSRPSSDGGRHTAAACAVAAVEVACLEPFAVDVHRRDDVAIVQPRGELDLATVETLRAALDDIKAAGRLVLDLRGLSFLACAGLHLLVALHQRAQRDGFQLALLAPAAPADKPIKLLGLDQALPFAAPDDALDRNQANRRAASHPGGTGQDVKNFGLTLEQLQYGAVRVAPRGELDLEHAYTFDEQLRRVEDARPRCIVLDLRELRFLDTCGIARLLAAQRRARRAGRRLLLVRGPRAIQRLLTLTAAHEMFEIVGDVPIELRDRGSGSNGAETVSKRQTRLAP